MEKAIEIIKQGGIVIFPTDTAFGIGCDATNKEAVRRLFEIRKRPTVQATPVLFDSIERVEEFVLPFSSNIRQLMKKYWPGALTLVLNCKTQKIPSLVRGGSKNLGVRIPDHGVPIEIIKGVGAPILGPSANFHGKETPYAFDHLDKELIKLVDFIIEGETKGGSLSSTVVDCTKSPWEILRKGAVSIE